MAVNSVVWKAGWLVGNLVAKTAVATVVMKVDM
jgi:hypothetical protein